MTETGLALRGNTQIINSFDDASRAAKAMAESGFFADSRNAAQAVVKILAGQEMGFGPFASMNGVYIIQGRPSIGANLMAAAVKKSGRYNYRIAEMSEKACSIDFYEGRDKIGNSTFTADDARKAGTKNMDKFPRNMLFARAISNGIRWFCPDVFNGSTVYTPEELGAEVNEDGDVIDVTPKPAVKVEAAQDANSIPAEWVVNELHTALAYSTSDKRTLDSLSLEDLETQLAKADKVAEDKRGEKYWKARTALETVMQYREREMEAAREAENE